jgi:pyruvate kinase
VVNTTDIKRLDDEIQSIIRRARLLEAECARDLDAVHPEFRGSAQNLVHYVALRQSDVSELQSELATLGLSSLGRAERNVMASLQAVSNALRALTGGLPADAGSPPTSLGLRSPAATAHQQAILGDPPADREVSIMITLPTEAAADKELVTEMLAAGMNVARINCARDDATTWEGMIQNVRAASADLSKDCRILMDLAGPKLRTGELSPGPRVIHIRPRRDALGRVVAPRRVRLMPDDLLQRGSKAAVIPVPRECIEYAEVDDEIRFRDTRGKKRRMRVVEIDAKGIVLEAFQGAYVETGMKFRLLRHEAGEELKYSFGELPAVAEPLLLRVGDELILHRHSGPGEPARRDAEGNIKAPAHIACQQAEVFEFVGVGDPVSLNDGKIAGVVTSSSEDKLHIEITKAKPTGSNLRDNRGINFPKSDLRLPGLTARDKVDLEFVVEHANAVSLSFVRKPEDIKMLQQELGKYPDQKPGVVIKLETGQGFRNLPWLLLTVMQSYPAAVMIARGDLAVECGWERLAELQEEILWFCEAAQLPVIWATQVLESKTKKGLPSRSEISDAAMAQRADCVMLNKGPHVISAIRMLDNILHRMQKHQFKKTARMPKLRVANRRS